MAHVSNLFKKKDYDTKISDTKSKHFSAADYNKFTCQTLDSKIKQKQLNHKSVIVGFINSADLDLKKVATLAINTELKAEQHKIIKLQKLYSNCR